VKTILIENKQGKVKLNESVTKESITRMVEEIGRLFGAKAAAEGADFGTIMNLAENAVDVLEIEINSPGGSVFDGYTIYQEIKSLQDRGVVVNATVTGMAASMATVICCACNNVSIVPHGQWMIHEASNVVAGNAETLRKQADLLDSVSGNIAEIYSRKTGKDIEDIRAMMKKETWMNAAQAKELGFVDSIVGEKQEEAKAVFDTESKGMTGILAKLFPGNEHAEQIEAQLHELDSLRADLTAAQGRIEELVNLEVEKAAIAGELAEVKESVEAKDAKIAELEAAAVSVEDRAKVLASELLAQTGHPAPVAVEENGETKSILAQFNELKGAEATEFFRANKKEIQAAQRNLSK